MNEILPSLKGKGVNFIEADGAERGRIEFNAPDGEYFHIDDIFENTKDIQEIMRIINEEIADCGILKGLEEKTILRAKSHKDYKCVVANMQNVLENNHSIYRLKKLRERFEEAK